MLIISQNKDKTTESLNLVIKEKRTCKSVFVNEEVFQKFKRITQENSIFLSTTELKGLGELVEKDMMKSVYIILEVKNNLILGIYSSRGKAKEILENLMKSYIKKEKVYEMPKNENEELILF